MQRIDWRRGRGGLARGGWRVVGGAGSDGSSFGDSGDHPGNEEARVKRRTMVGGAVTAALVLLALAAGYLARRREANQVGRSQAGQRAGGSGGGGTREPALRAHRDGGRGRPRGAIALGRRPGGVLGRLLQRRQGGEPVGRARAAREAAARSAARSRSSGSRSSRRERPADFGRLFMARFGDIARIEARRPRRTGDAEERERFSTSTASSERLRRRRARVGRQAGRGGPRQSADPRDRAPPAPPAGGGPRPAARHGAHAAGRVHRLRPVGPGGVRRHRQAGRPKLRAASRACASTRSAPSRAVRKTARW